MERLGLSVGRLVLVLAAAVGVVVVVANSSGHPALIVGAALFLAATGALVNRVWAAALPLGVAIALMGFDGLVNGTEEGYDMSWWGYFVIFAVIAAAVSLCVLVGVGVRRVARAVGERRGPSAPARS
jgi:hypothetical protein